MIKEINSSIFLYLGPNNVSKILSKLQCGQVHYLPCENAMLKSRIPTLPLISSTEIHRLSCVAARVILKTVIFF